MIGKCKGCGKEMEQRWDLYDRCSDCQERAQKRYWRIVTILSTFLWGPFQVAGFVFGLMFKVAWDGFWSAIDCIEKIKSMWEGSIK